ncbi:FAD-dependent monooxygenase [Legionella sp.]|uniref:FAD-dependent monooxygenase n=1 Tax=Legionella sp. TaxID=459 RepID=UPI0025811AB7|nr:FAD-dependent monooxygenase [Legionella sp.]
MDHKDVIIVGAGPTGLSLAVELGLRGIDTLIIEKSKQMDRSHPRAQGLNPRTIQFFRRWGISESLKAKKLIRDGYPIRYIWCANLNGKVFASTDDMSETINSDLSPENYVRIPLWLTQDTLREKLSEFNCVQLIEDCKILNIDQDDKGVRVKIRYKGNTSQISSKYLVACDGADSTIRRLANFTTTFYPPEQKMLQIVFESEELKSKMTVPEATFYYNLLQMQFFALGAIDGSKRWSADFACPATAKISDFDLPILLDQLAGFHFEKKIESIGFWYMKPLIADQFREKNIFLVGDSAHVLTPIGGHGFNTSVADAVNLAWKLSAVLQQQATSKLLDSYEIERHRIAIQKLEYITDNTKKMLTIRQAYPPQTMPEKFAEENQKIAELMSANLKLVLGDAYDTSPIVFTDLSEGDQYDPKLAKAGYFAPHVWLTEEKCLYDFLSLNHSLLVWNKTDSADIKTIETAFAGRHMPLLILNLNHYKTEKSSIMYPKAFYLIRPDWHISWCGERFPNPTQLVNQLLP